MTTRYSGPQRLGFACLLIGTLSCGVGLFAPYWREGKIGVGDIASLFDNVVGDLFGDVNLAHFYGGLIFYCVELATGDKECSQYDMKGHQAIMIMLSSAQLLLSILCMVAALCRMCCCQGGKTVCHGIITFMAGAGGIAVVALFASSYADVDSWEKKLATLTMPSLAWAFYIYAAGSGLILISSFMLCFASPDNVLTGMVMSHLPPSVTVTQQYSRFDNIQQDGTVSQQMQPQPSGGVTNGY